MDLDIPTPDNSQPTENKFQPPVSETNNIRPNKPKRTAANYWEELEEGEPGYAWSNPKARAEYERAMEMIQDKDFSLSKHEVADSHDDRC